MTIHPSSGQDVGGESVCFSMTRLVAGGLVAVYLALVLGLLGGILGDGWGLSSSLLNNLPLLFSDGPQLDSAVPAQHTHQTRTC